MESYLFWDSETRLCVVVCEDAAPGSNLALAAGAEERWQIVASDGGGATAGRRFLIGSLAPGPQEAIVVDLARPDDPLASFRLASAGAIFDKPELDKHWVTAFFAPRTPGGAHELRLLRVPAEHSRDYLLEMALNTLSNRKVEPEGCWMTAGLATPAVASAVEPAALVFPPVPTLTVSAEIAVAEASPQQGPFETDLIAQAFKPQTGLPRLALSASEPQRIAAIGSIVAVGIAHQIRFFAQKDEFLRTVGRPGVNSLNPEDIFQDETLALESPSTHALRFSWDNGQTFRDAAQLRPVVIEIAAEGRSGIVRYNEAAIGDDLYLVAPQPLFSITGRDGLAKTVGFRVDLRGFTPLDTSAPDIAMLVAEAERIAANNLRRSLDLDDFSTLSAVEKPSAGRPLQGLMQLAHQALRHAPSFATFATGPALFGELTAWSAPARVAPVLKGTLAGSLAATAQIVTELSERPSLAEQASVIRSLRDGEAMQALRDARIKLPLSLAEAERAREVATALADDDVIEEAEEIAFERGDFTAEGALRKFRTRAAEEWTSVTIGETLKQSVADLIRDDIAQGAPTQPEDPAGRSRRLEEECRQFEAQLQSARALGENAAELDRIDADYRARKASAKLDTRRSLPRLRKRLAALTTGPVIERHFGQAVTALEAWAALPQFSATLLGEDAGAALSLPRWDAIVARLKPRSADPESGWGQALNSLTQALGREWRESHHDLQSEDIARRAALVQQYGGALLHHRAYMALARAKGDHPRLANALTSWPQDAGATWRIATEELGETALRLITEPPRLLGREAGVGMG